MAESHALLPWAEANQGLLTLLALGVALGLAYYQWKWALRAEMRAERAYCDWAIRCAEHSMENTAEAIKTIQTRDQSSFRTSISMWRFHNGHAIATLEEILTDKPSNPDFAHHVNRLLRTMNMEVKGEEGSVEALRHLQDHHKYVGFARHHIERIKPKTDRERICLAIRSGILKVIALGRRLTAWRPFRKKYTYAQEWGQPFDLTKKPWD